MTDLRHLVKNPEIDAQGKEIAVAFEQAGYEVDQDRGAKSWSVLHDVADVPPEPTFYYDFDLQTWRGFALTYSDRLGVKLPDFLSASP